MLSKSCPVWPFSVCRIWSSGSVEEAYSVTISSFHRSGEGRLLRTSLSDLNRVFVVRPSMLGVSLGGPFRTPVCWARAGVVCVTASSSAMSRVLRDVTIMMASVALTVVAAVHFA